MAPVNKTDTVLLPQGLQALKQVAKQVGLDLRGAYLNLDGGFDSKANRKAIFNAGMIPNIKRRFSRTEIYSPWHTSSRRGSWYAKAAV